MEVSFPDGVVVRAERLADREANAGWRDFGLYLDVGWSPTWPAELIAWPDFGVPTRAADASDAILRAFERAKHGERVEVGCAGGLGRTGTVIACMAILSGVPPEEAVAWTRANYRPDAIETAEQERWVAWFAAWEATTPSPETPAGDRING
jgi:rhodanese/phosphatase family protein